MNQWSHTAEKKPGFWDIFTSQPHRMFFSSGVIFAMVFMTFFALQFKGVIGVTYEPKLFHFYSFAFIIFSQFFIGFLFTTFPRFLGVPELPRTANIRVFILYQAGALLFVVSQFISVYLTLLSVVLTFAAQFIAFAIMYQIYRFSPVPQKDEPGWMLKAFGLGLVAHLLFIAYLLIYLFLPEVGWTVFIYEAAKNIAVYLYLFFMAFAVGQRMIPFFTTAAQFGYQPNKTPGMLKTVFYLLIAKTLFATAGLHLVEALADAALAGFIGRELVKWKLPVFKVSAMLWVMYLSLFWIPLGFGLSAVENVLWWSLGTAYDPLERLSLHILMVGFLTTILIGFGSRVTLGHSGRPPVADRYTVFVFLFVQFVVFFRAASSVLFFLLPQAYYHAILFTAGLWVLMFVLWSRKYLIYLLR
ncbi:NnrS family protein [Nitrosophilus alvini]|uniref:NnrS family protein n=1 Tax=Nitrosophilus alvini TaxID=2714855 RepID=UPI00190BD3B8|nr:NnrS family protein [Nitrosophilus alvini]